MFMSGDWGSLSKKPKKEITTDDHYTPDWCMKMFQGWHDPCPARSDIDGLSYDWCKHDKQIYVNPPYSNPMPWVEKAIKQSQLYEDAIIVMLLKHDSSTRWFSKLQEAGARFWMLQGRMSFNGPNQIKKGAVAPFPSILAVLS